MSPCSENNPLLCALGSRWSAKGLNLCLTALSWCFPVQVSLFNSTVTWCWDLDLNAGGLASLPEHVGELRGLQTLAVWHNKLVSLPRSVGRLVNLKILWLDRNSITELPSTIGSLTLLEFLSLSNNLLTSLPETLGRLTKLKSVWGQINHITSLPSSVGWCSSLVTLALATNQLKSVPATIGRLTTLRLCLFNSNSVQDLPEALCHATHLQELNLTANKLCSLPFAFGRLAYLERLSVLSNRLTSLPTVMGKLNALVVLAIGANVLTSLPESLGELTVLRCLWANNNLLCKFPASLSRLTALEVVNALDNPMDSELERAKLPSTCSRVLLGEGLYNKWLRTRPAERHARALTTDFLPRAAFVSLGYNCEVASMMKTCRLREFSSPFDWMITSMDFLLDMFASRFEHFCDVEPTPVGNFNVFSNAIYPHDNFAGNREKEAAKYKRRIERLLDILERGEVEVVFLRLAMLHADCDKALLLDAVISSMFPNAMFRIIVFSNNVETETMVRHGRVLLASVARFKEMPEEVNAGGTEVLLKRYCIPTPEQN